MHNNLYIITYVSYFVDTFSGTTYYDTQRTLTQRVPTHTAPAISPTALSVMEEMIR